MIKIKIKAILVCGEIKLVEGDNIYSVTPTLSTPAVGPDGLVHVVVTCDASNIPRKNAYIDVN